MYIHIYNVHMYTYRYMCAKYNVHSHTCIMYNVHATMYMYKVHSCTCYNVHATMYMLQCTCADQHVHVYTFHWVLLWYKYVYLARLEN